LGSFRATGNSLIANSASAASGWVRRFASKAIQPGDRVAYLSFNTHQLLEGYYGVVLAHAIVMPLNVRLSPLELKNILNHSGARMLLFENDFAPDIQRLRRAR
jgi:acyl-CoA synthetase (AMP-forming)/AMP-acid ligase II